MPKDNGQKPGKPVGAGGHRKRMRERVKSDRNRLIPKREAIEMLLYYVIPVADTRGQAVQLLEKYDDDPERLLNAPPEELTTIGGIGTNSAKFLNTAGRLISLCNKDNKNLLK